MSKHKFGVGKGWPPCPQGQEDGTEKVWGSGTAGGLGWAAQGVKRGGRHCWTSE